MQRTLEETNATLSQENGVLKERVDHLEDQNRGLADRLSAVMTWMAGIAAAAAVTVAPTPPTISSAIASLPIDPTIAFPAPDSDLQSPYPTPFANAHISSGL